MVEKTLKKIIIFVTVFTLVFSNCGYTLQVLAASDGITLFGFTLFGNSNISFDVYFLDENGDKHTENISDVNSLVTMILELKPKSNGYLKNGTIKAVFNEEDDVNFKFEDVMVSNDLDEKELFVSTPAEETLVKSEITIDSDKNQVETNTVELDISDTNSLKDDNLISNTVVQDNVVENNVQENVTTENEVLEENKVLDNNVVSENAEVEIPNQEEIDKDDKNTEENSTINEVVQEEIQEQVQDEQIDVEEFVDEESALNEENDLSEIIKSSVAKATILKDNEINVEDIVEDTKVYVTISFKTQENLNIEDLYKKIKVKFEGIYINSNLEEIQASAEKELKIGWKYSKDIEVFSEYTKVSPFKIGETQGTILENTITVKRDITESNYLPLKETRISLNIPTLGENKPVKLDVSAIKLKATRGEDVNETTFSQDNWYYDDKTNTLNITVENTDGKFTYGEDIYVVTLRYDYFVTEGEVNLSTTGNVKVIEFSDTENNEIIKSLDKEEKVNANIGELITYSISTSESKINKGKINANYNQEEEKYFSEFDTTVNVNILTNDVLDEFILKDTKEYYIDKDNLEFETNDVKYKDIRFKFNEIQNFLEQGGIIDIKNNNGELLYTLNNDLVKSEQDVEYSIEGDVRSIEISFKNIKANGNISVEFTKAIGKCSYDKTAFANFKKLQSRISSLVKYSGDSEGTNLTEIRTTKEFEESNTNAEISMNKVSLSTTELNQNVEFKIELNNNNENSDLYVNPVFEIALPKYVSNIDIKAVNILYEAGLSVGNMIVYRAEDGTQRMRIEILGTQTEFSDSDITNGTNIIINTNIELDKYAPRKDEQVKMYYINSGVTNYISQTKWTIGTNIPTGIIKKTNGFDSYVFKINAPIGLVAVNEIQDYDGENSIVSSLKQGTETREIAMEKGAQVAKMNLIAINNTENKCTDVAFLGRVPVKGVTDVKTGEVLETNIDTTMVSQIIENEENPLSAKIYYSENPNADKNLVDQSNGWTEEISDLTNIKSFLIIPDNIVEPGYIFKYTYDFMIPENLPYESKIFGAFGAFYNNHSDVAITYETSRADLVGVVTKSGPKIDAILSVDIGDNTEIKQAGFLNYTLKIVNSGSVTAEKITVTNPIPKGTSLYTYINDGYGRYGLFKSESQNDLTWDIDKLEPGEVKEFNYILKARDYSQENANLSIIKNKAKVNISNLALDVESNEVSNKITKANFDIDILSGVSNSIIVNQAFIMYVDAENISNEDLNNVILQYKLPEQLVYKSYQNRKGIEISEENYDTENNILTLKIEKWNKNEKLKITINTVSNYGYGKQFSNVINLINENGEIESSQILELNYQGPSLQASQVSSAINNEITEGEEVEFIVSILNTGSYEAKDVSIYSAISENLEDVKIESSGSSVNDFSLTSNNELVSSIFSIPADDSVNVHISGKAKEVEDDTQTISSKMLISSQYTKEISTNEILLKILNDPNKKKEDTEEEINNIMSQIDSDDDIINEKIDNSSNQSNEQISDNNEDIINQNTINNEHQINQQLNNTEINIADSSEINNNTDNKNTQNETKNDSQDIKENTETIQEVVKPKYTISGKVWLDINKNGIMDEGEKGISGVQLQLQKDNINVKATVTPNDGLYSFKDVDAGKYVIVYSYDNNLYESTVYKNQENGSNRASYARDLTSGNAITDTIIIENQNVENMNLGLKEKDKLDFSISKNITLAKVSTNGKIIEHKYDNLDLAKLEISAKDLDKTSIELHYQIIVKNEGNISGKVMQIADYLPKDTILDTEQSINWYLGNDGNAYNDSISELAIAPGEIRTLNLVLIRNMNTENTGVLANKVVITKTEVASDSIVENISNNDSTQETIISVRTGYTGPIIINIIVIFAACVIIYLQRTQKVKIDFKNFKIKRIYK